MSAAERCPRWPGYDRCVFGGVGGTTCAACERFEAHGQALAALAKQRLLMLSGAEELEADRRERYVRQLLRNACVKLDAAALDDALDCAHGHAVRRCKEVLGVTLADAILEDGQHALHLESGWLREWAEKWLADRAAAAEACHG